MDFIGPAEHAFKLALVIKEASPMMIDKLRREFSKLFGAVELVTKATKSWKEAVKIGVLGVGGLIVAIASAAKIMIQLDDRMAILGQRFGMTNDHINQFTADLYKVGAASGVVADQLGEVAHELIEAGFKNRRKDLVELSVSVFKFSEATGVSLKSAAGFGAELSKVGFSGIVLMDKLANLRRSLQLSTQEFEEVVKTTEEAVKAIYAYGNAAGSVTDNQINRFASGMGQLSAQLKTMGISATTTSKILSGLMDPNAFIENMNLYATMGFSLDEVLGNIEGRMDTFGKTEQMLDRVGEGMKRLSQGGGLWLANWAKQLGIPAHELKLIADGFRNIDPEQRKMMQQEMELNKIWGEMGKTITPLFRSFRMFFANFILLIKPAVDILELFLTGLSEVFKFVSGVFSKLEKTFGAVGTTVKTMFGAVILTGIALFIAGLVKAYVSTLKVGAGVASLATQMGALAGTTTAATVALGGFNAASALTGAVGKGGVGKVGSMLFMNKGALEAELAAAEGGMIVNTLTKPGILQKFVGIGKTWGKTLLKGFGWAALATAFINPIMTKKFTGADLGALLLGAGMMMGATPWGIAAMVAGGLLMAIPALSKFELFGPRGFMKAPEAQAEELKKNIGVDATKSIDQSQKELELTNRENKYQTSESIAKLLRELKEEQIKTKGAIQENTANRNKIWKADSAGSVLKQFYNTVAGGQVRSGQGRHNP